MVMMDLRTRIACLVAGERNTSVTDAYNLTDKLIEELRLHYQYENGGARYDTKPVGLKPNGTWKVRIVSPHEIFNGDQV